MIFYCDRNSKIVFTTLKPLSMKFIAVLFVFIFFKQTHLSGQEKSDFKFGVISKEDFILPKSSAIDSTTGGVIVADIGSTSFILNERRWVSFVFKKFRRIKVINNKAFDLATIKVRLYGNRDDRDKIDDLKASVYNIENGKIVETKVSNTDVFEDKLSPNTVEKKFTLPSVKEGSIIEYAYTITSYRYYAIPSWRFQSLEYPCLYSGYEVLFPNMLKYAVASYGLEPFFINNTTKVKNNRYFNGDISIISDDTRHVWVKKDVPAFKAENFINAPVDYLDKVEFFLSQTYNGAEVRDIYTSWEGVTSNLLATGHFGAAIDKENAGNLLNTVEKITSGDDNLMESAKHLFFYVRDNFTCVPDEDIYLSDDLYDINKKKKGSVADLNLLLCGLLRQGGIPVDPVILSTKEYGTNPADFPLPDKMNYVICMARIFGDTVYLDASRPELGFGKLSLDCYNGHARIVSINGASIYFSPDKIKEQKSTKVFIINEGNGKEGGSVETSFGFFGTEKLRKDVKKSGSKEYLEKSKAGFTDGAVISNFSIDSLNKIEFPATTRFEFSFPVECVTRNR
jgi:hypothetical protein